MNNAKNTIIISGLNKKIRDHEDQLFKIEKKIQKEKSSLGSIIVNNREAAPTILKGAKSASAILFGLSLPYMFAGDIVSAAVALGASLVSYSSFAIATRPDKHDRVWRKRCLSKIEDLKKSAKKVKAKLYSLYTQAEDIMNESITESNNLDNKNKWDNKKTDTNNTQNTDNKPEVYDIIQNPVLVEEIKNDFKKDKYKNIYKKVFTSRKNNHNNLESK